MSDVAERKAPALQQPSRAMPATAVGQLEHPAQATGMFGRHILLTHHSLFGHVIEAGDVISVDFDARRITCDSDYLIAFYYGQGHQWFGVRRFHHRLDGSLEIADPHGLDALQWGKCTPEILNSITVFGRVLEVFKPVSKTRCRHG
ncbi:Uncharacterised protein [Delftia tsuruhatensis]|uniref:hypothetical protein n=1 Tax=Delftia tsuruhatensis TaxID=180282 RepID=UPI001E77DD00|nr:hypothetical protein [Delftia tsuruhatensis]CAB5720076.1 Uncharacterised protein [Delftia tsuruhatensis]CAC9685585.1 Uncharacterised protein [Delftia tsuruhatensis]